jgi:hypothetical protein
VDAVTMRAWRKQGEAFEAESAGQIGSCDFCMSLRRIESAERRPCESGRRHGASDVSLLWKNGWMQCAVGGL